VLSDLYFVLCALRDCSYTAKRLRPKAQGCRFGYPGSQKSNESTATRLRPEASIVKVATRSGLMANIGLSQG
jgi:hypothetical protein